MPLLNDIFSLIYFHNYTVAVVHQLTDFIECDENCGVTSLPFLSWQTGYRDIIQLAINLSVGNKQFIFIFIGTST